MACPPLGHNVGPSCRKVARYADCSRVIEQGDFKPALDELRHDAKAEPGGRKPNIPGAAVREQADGIRFHVMSSRYTPLRRGASVTKFAAPSRIYCHSC